MPRLGIFNLFIGFSVLFFAAAAGAVLATDMTDAFLSAPSRLQTWETTLQTSAHGHTNLFALIHIALGLTLPYSRMSGRVKTLQSAGLFCGTLAMGPLMYVRAGMGPSASLDALTIFTGVLLAGALAAIGSHAVGLGGRLMRP